MTLYANVWVWDHVLFDFTGGKNSATIPFPQYIIDIPLTQSKSKRI